MAFVSGNIRNVITNDWTLKDTLTALATTDSYDITLDLETRMYIAQPVPVLKLTGFVAQRPFTDYTLPLACSMFGIPRGLERFPRFEYGKYLFVEDRSPFSSMVSSAFDHLIAELQIRRDTMALKELNETTCSAFVAPFLITISSIFKDMMVKTQHSVSSRYGWGPFDFALEARTSGAILGVTQVKREGFSKALAQNLVRLESSISRRKRKFSQISTDTSFGGGEAKAFGLVTDSKEWWAIECVMDTNTEGLSFRMSKLAAVINYCDNEGWQKQVKDVFCVLVWLLDHMLSQEAKAEEAAAKADKLQKGTAKDETAKEQTRARAVKGLKEVARQPKRRTRA